jgi:uncharacterized protein YrrD
MLRSIKDLDDYSVGATDGIIGHVKDFYFDDKAWVIRYLVVNTGSWLAGRKVLVSPISIGRPDWTQKILPVWITQDQVRKSPGIDTAKPVSRQHEKQYFAYYGYPYYWNGGGLWGTGAYPNAMMPGYAGFVATPPAVQSAVEEVYARAAAAHHQDDDLHLRSCTEVMGYRIQATDGAIGHVHGLLVDDETWAIRYIVVDTGHWWDGHQVLVAPQWASDVSWSNRTVSVNVTRQAVKKAPQYDLTALLDREKELSIYNHYGHSGYWETEAKHALDLLER